MNYLIKQYSNLVDSTNNRIIMVILSKYIYKYIYICIDSLFYFHLQEQALL
jgi:sulfur relay (sulfurtransferase) DsrF/TusC family protein